MARPADYSDAEIIKAGQALQADNKRVSAFAIREALGGGNINRIKSIWSDYLASNEEREAAADVELPAAFAEQVESAITGLVGDMRVLAGRLYNDARAQVNAEMRDTLSRVRKEQEQAAAAEQDAIAMVEQLDGQLFERDQLIESLQQAVDTHKAEASESRGEIKQLLSRLEQAEARADRAEQRIESLLARLGPAHDDRN